MDKENLFLEKLKTDEETGLKLITDRRLDEFLGMFGTDIEVVEQDITRGEGLAPNYYGHVEGYAVNGDPRKYNSPYANEQVEGWQDVLTAEDDNIQSINVTLLEPFYDERGNIKSYNNIAKRTTYYRENDEGNATGLTILDQEAHLVSFLAVGIRKRKASRTNNQFLFIKSANHKQLETIQELLGNHLAAFRIRKVPKINIDLFPNKE